MVTTPVYVTLKDEDAEKVYATYHEDGVLLTSVNLATTNQILFYLPYDQLEEVYINKPEAV